MYVECFPTDYMDEANYRLCIRPKTLANRHHTSVEVCCQLATSWSMFSISIFYTIYSINPPSTLCWSDAQLKPTLREIRVILDTRLDMASQVSNVCRSAYTYCKNNYTCKSDYRGLQDASARARDSSPRLRKRGRLHWPSVAPPWDDQTLGGQNRCVHQETPSPEHNGGGSTTS